MKETGRMFDENLIDIFDHHHANHDHERYIVSSVELCATGFSSDIIFPLVLVGVSVNLT
jgi:hypothetical protein